MFSLPNEFNGSTRHSAICSNLKVIMLGLTSEIEASISSSCVWICQFLLLCY